MKKWMKAASHRMTPDGRELDKVIYTEPGTLLKDPIQTFAGRSPISVPEGDDWKLSDQSLVLTGKDETNLVLWIANPS